MDLLTKYSELIEKAKNLGIDNLQVREQNNVLYIDGDADTAAAKDEVWAVYQKLDPEFRSADGVMNINAPESTEPAEVEYTVVAGDNLTKIAKAHGTTWQKIHEANKDRIKNPDLIQIGWKLKIPKG